VLFSSELFGTALTTFTVHSESGMKPGSGTRVCTGDGFAAGVVIAGRASARMMIRSRRKAMIRGLFVGLDSKCRILEKKK